MIAQAQSSVVVPDLLCFQVLWGGNKRQWPSNRTSELLRMLDDQSQRWGIESVRLLETSRSAGASSAPGNDNSEGQTRLPDRSEPGHAPCASEESTAEARYEGVSIVGGTRYTCPPACPLHGFGRHRHLGIAIRVREPDVTWERVLAEGGADALRGTFLGALEVFGDGEGTSRTYQWHIKPPSPTKNTTRRNRRSDKDDAEWELDADDRDQQALIRRFRQRGETAAVYLPLMVFGASPRVGLPVRQRLLHRAITRELTRLAKGRKSDRPDRAEVIAGGRNAGQRRNGASSYPGLEAGVGYVGFNGNGGKKEDKHHGRGYSLKSWMNRSRYPADSAETQFWKGARVFLKDLAAVAEVFGLVVAAWNRKRREWQDLPVLLELTRSTDGRRWLRSATIRLYTEADYLDRWRTWIADKMGFSVIPRPGDEPSRDEGVHMSAGGLRSYLKTAGVTNAAFAKAVGVSNSEVSKRMNGSRKWDEEWADRVEVVLAEHPEWTGRVSKKSG